jgi:hypothetical protein
MTMTRFASATKQSSFRSNSALTNGQLAHYAPSVMADSAHHSRAERYSFIPTIQVIDGLRAEGFEPYEVRQTKVRNLDKVEHTKHMVRLRHINAITSKEEVPEIILLNSHDGSSSYQLLAGVFRFVCSNGLIAGDLTENIRIRHAGNIVDNVIEGATRILHETEEVVARIGEYKGIELSQQESMLFAEAAIQLRWGDEKPVTAMGVLASNRYADRKTDLWTTFNRVQENMIKGGVAGKSSTGRRTTTRAVGGVNENVKLNKALWTLADSMAALKTNKATDEFIARHEHSYQ